MISLAAVTVVAATLSSPAGVDRATDPPITSNPAPETPSLGVDFFAQSMTARQMEREVMKLLPEGSRSADVLYRNTDRAPEEEPAPMRGFLLMDLDTGAGFGGLNLIVYPPDRVILGTPDGSDSTTLACPPKAVRCIESTTANGEVRAIQTELLYNGVTLNEVKVRTPSGAIVVLTVSNSANYKFTRPPTTEIPPLTLDQMLEIAEAEVWAEE